ncbi:ATP-binding protein [Porifericola rhodea]|uniref:sensor histidine kinase n=1 Tax=Porifericola rhodea TaxID=930972 RepID=UPI002666984C|nr:ATP-binding protein [Porifericola rhodea]WKN32646.1 ATP-binding protein [Porifericola rhodea]
MKSFSLNIIIRVLLLLASLTALAYIFGRVELFFNHIILIVIIGVQIYELTYYVQRTNREIAKLLLSIKNSDFTINFSPRKNDRHFKELNAACREIIEAYKQVRIEKEAQFAYLKLIVKYINVGIISLKDEDEIVLMNQPALDILQTDSFHYWRNLKHSHPGFVQEVELLKENESRLIEVKVNGKIKRLSAHLSSAILLGESYRILTFQDIEQEINQSELDAWHKLIRILTHEIMNSVTPISSLTETMLMLLYHKEGILKSSNQLNDELVEDLAFSLRTIQKRSDGLLGFVEDYRKLSRIPLPQKEILMVEEILESTTQLMRAELKKNNIELSIHIAKEGLVLNADRKQLEQILINLISNSIQAMANNPAPKLELSAYEEGGQLLIIVKDNGTGISEDKLNQIFIPFFSTKAQGSGIGLSLSRNMMSQHGGKIQVNSVPGQSTSFSLSFPNTTATADTTLF